MGRLLSEGGGVALRGRADFARSARRRRRRLARGEATGLQTPPDLRRASQQPTQGVAGRAPPRHPAPPQLHPPPTPAHPSTQQQESLATETERRGGFALEIPTHKPASSPSR